MCLIRLNLVSSLRVFKLETSLLLLKWFPVFSSRVSGLTVSIHILCIYVSSILLPYFFNFFSILQLLVSILQRSGSILKHDRSIGNFKMEPESLSIHTQFSTGPFVLPCTVSTRQLGQNTEIHALYTKWCQTQVFVTLLYNMVSNACFGTLLYNMAPKPNSSFVRCFSIQRQNSGFCYAFIQ